MVIEPYEHPGLTQKKKKVTKRQEMELTSFVKTKQSKLNKMIEFRKKKKNSTSMPEPDDYCSLLSRRSQVTGETLQGSLI